MLEELGAGLHEVARRKLRRTAARVQPRAHQQLRAARTRHRNVGESALLALRVHADGEPVLLLHPLLIGGRRLLLALNIQVERRQVRVVPSQRVGQIPTLRQPRLLVGRIDLPRHGFLALSVGGEHPVAQAEDGDAVPLQALRAVDSQDLDGLRVRLAQGSLQPLLAFVGHAQVREERPQRRARRLLLVGGGHRNELVQRGSAPHRQGVRDDVVQGAHDEDCTLNLLGDRAPNALTHRAQTLPQQPHAARSLLADRGAPLHSPPGVGRVVHRVQENGLVGAGPLVACQGARPVAQRDQVGGPQVNARQEARQPRGGRHVVGQLQRRAHVLHGGLVQQPAQAHDLRRDTGLAQSGVNKGEILAAPTQDGDCAPLAILGRLRTDALHEVHRCGQRVLIHLRVRDLHGALPRSLPGNQDRRLCLERVLALLIGGHLTQGRCHAIRRVQNRHVVTPRGGQREGLPGLGRSALETIQEGLQG